jgi:hypothetical protein
MKVSFGDNNLKFGTGRLSLIHRKLLISISTSCYSHVLARNFIAGMITLLCKLKIIEALLKPQQVGVSIRQINIKVSETHSKHKRKLKTRK